MNRFDMSTEHHCLSRLHSVVRVDVTGVARVYIMGWSAAPVATTTWDFGAQTLAPATGLPEDARLRFQRALAAQQAAKTAAAQPAPLAFPNPDFLGRQKRLLKSQLKAAQKSGNAHREAEVRAQLDSVRAQIRAERSAA